MYAGLFFVALATLMYEILLTRIFSVTMWYHFAFMAISVAMFGAAVGSIIVYAAPRTFRAEQALSGVDNLLRAPPALLELERVRAVCRREVDPEQPGNRAAKAVDGLVGVTDNNEVRPRFRRGEQLEELELRGVDVLELVHEDEPEFGTQLFTELVLRLQQLRPGSGPYARPTAVQVCRFGLELRSVDRAPLDSATGPESDAQPV